MSDPADAFPVRVGTAGWALPAAERDRFGEGGSNLARYATRFDAVEVNSSFYRRHRPDTWRRWADSVPATFRFSVKLPKAISHAQGCADWTADLDNFAADVGGLGEKLAVVLVQFPPSHLFNAAAAQALLGALRSRVPARIACEPRHASWFEAEAEQLMVAQGVARVAADPARVPSAASPGGGRDLHYWRLHGSPAIYRSSYDEVAIGGYARAMTLARAQDVWCIFDNTASSAATANAFDLCDALRRAT